MSPFLPTSAARKIVLFALLFILLLASAFAFLSVRQAAQQRDYLNALKSLSFNKYLDLPVGYSSVSHIAAWDAYVFTAPEFQCVTGGPYVILVHKGAQADRTILWLEVGDECWPGHPQCPAGGAPQAPDAAILQRLVAGVDISPFGPTAADKANPVAQWNYIYLPTCDGSWHFGDAAADYDEDGVPDHWHNGLRQTSAAVSLMRQLFPGSQKILVFGSSNGGFGTYGAAPIVRLAFPKTPLYVLDDSGPGVFSPDRPDVWPAIQKAWNLAPMFPPGCPRCTQQLAYLSDWMLQRDPRLKIGLFTSYRDEVVSAVLGMDPAEYQRLLLATTGEIHQDHPASYQRFVVAGKTHCINDYYRSIDGVTVWDWLASLVNDDPRWTEHLQ